MAMPLEGIRVVDWTGFLMGPRAGAHLADMGAEVIKIEHPAGGEPTRNVRGGVLPTPTGYVYTFHLENRGKKSMTLDLSQPRGQEVVHKLIETADVFLSNFQYQALKRFHMDYDTLSGINPRLIYALGSGWGMRGADKDRPAFDYAVFARSGLMDSFGEPGTPPVMCRPGLGDHITAVTLAYAISLALYNRERTGEGQMVHASLFGCLIDAGALTLQAHLATGFPMGRNSRREAQNPLWNFYEVKDHEWVQFSMSHSDHYWPEFCRVLGIEECEKDPRFIDHDARDEHHLELIAIIDRALGSRAKEEWVERLTGTDIVWAFVTSYSDLAKDPQVWANDYITEVDDPSIGRINMVGIPIEMSKTPGKVRAGAPELGQHTEEVLLELGYTWDDIIGLKDAGIIG
ncbi:MAG: CaiB/BaiF CoA transferase family protein [Dehalococcoidia bacterium]